MNRSSAPVHPAPEQSGLLHAGITLREHLAGLAMQGLLANPSTEQEAVRIGRQGRNVARELARVATTCADALLDELAGGEGNSDG